MAYESDKEIQEIVNFSKHLEKSVYEMLDGMYDLTEKEELQKRERFNIEIKMNGKSVTLQIHAELYERLQTFLADEVEELRS